MRVLVASDLHYDLRQYDWLLERSAEVDLVALAGDLLDVASSVPLEAQVVAVREYLTRMARRTTVAACSGNHDLDHRGDHGEKATRWLPTTDAAGLLADGTDTLVGDTLVSVLAWWEGPVTRGALEAQLEAAAATERRRWVWLYHSPPEGALSWTGTRHFGDDVGAGLVERFAPDVVLCGHIHQSPFTPEGSWWERRGTTWLCNAGRQMGSVPAHVELDLDEGTATWSSAAGSETVPLAG